MKFWYLMITFHAAAGFVAFGSGLLVLSPARARRHRRGLAVYLSALIGLVVFMLGAMVSHWADMGRTEQILFSGLVVLGLYMVYRANHARRLYAAQTYKVSAYIDDIGFTLISLFNGFVIVGALDLGAPAWVVVLGAVAATLGGNWLIKAAKKSEEAARTV